MKNFGKKALYLTVAICFTFCAPKETVRNHFPQEIKTVYFQKGIAEKEKSGQEIQFYIEFKKPLSKELNLEKIYFRNQEARIKKINATLYKAILLQQTSPKDLILDSDPRKEYGNQAPDMTKPKFDLKPNEAMLEYKSNDTIKYFKLTRVKEKEMILQP